MIDLREQLGQAVSGAYQIGEELGGGGMSRVFLADDIALGRSVVIKVLHPELAAGVNAERFKREVQLVGAVAASAHRAGAERRARSTACRTTSCRS